MAPHALKINAGNLRGRDRISQFWTRCIESRICPVTVDFLFSGHLRPCGTMNKSSALSMRDWQRIAATMLIKGLRLSLTFRAEPGARTNDSTFASGRVWAWSPTRLSRLNSPSTVRRRSHYLSRLVSDFKLRFLISRCRYLGWIPSSLAASMWFPLASPIAIITSCFFVSFSEW